MQWWYGVGVQHCCVVHLCSCAGFDGGDLCCAYSSRRTYALHLHCVVNFSISTYSQKLTLADTETLAGVARAPGSFPPNSQPLSSPRQPLHLQSNYIYLYYISMSLSSFLSHFINCGCVRIKITVVMMMRVCSARCPYSFHHVVAVV